MTVCVRALIAVIAVALSLSAQAANFVVINGDGPGEGFNDDTPRDPVGNNPGTTLGEQRLFAFNFAADLLGDKLVSTVDVLVNATFDELDCGPDSATLGQAGANDLVDFENDPPAGAEANTFYAIALANALAGRDLATDNADISAQFNSDIDEDVLCLTGVDWYYGVDSNPPGDDIDFLGTVVHELIHGLGFASFANVSNGEFIGNTPDVYSRLIRDLTLGQTWDQLTDEERQESATNDGNVVFEGASTTSNGAPTLNAGSNQGFVQLFAPVEVQPGSSISHWDVDLDPNALMEPADTGDIDVVSDGIGLATCALQDLGWVLTSGTVCPGNGSSGGGDTGGGGTGGGDTGGGSTGGGGTTAPPAGGGGGGGSGAFGQGALLVMLSLMVVRRRYSI